MRVTGLPLIGRFLDSANREPIRSAYAKRICSSSAARRSRIICSTSACVLASKATVESCGLRRIFAEEGPNWPAPVSSPKSGLIAKPSVSRRIRAIF